MYYSTVGHGIVFRDAEPQLTALQAHNRQKAIDPVATPGLVGHPLAMLHTWGQRDAQNG